MRIYKNADGVVCAHYHCTHCSTPMVQAVGNDINRFLLVVKENPSMLNCDVHSRKGGKSPKVVRPVRC